MKTFTLSNGLTMPMIGYGTWDIHDTQPIVDALNSGYRLIDTACMYGNETIVSKAIQQSGIDRKSIFIETKLDGSSRGYGGAIHGIESALKN